VSGFVYLGALLVSLGGLALIDRRFRLAFWAHPRRTALTLAIGVVGFLRGESPHVTGLLIAPELPVEEAVFLTLLCYVALLAWRWFDRQSALRQRWADRTADGDPEGRP
jgi:hypothetical protein